MNDEQILEYMRSEPMDMAFKDNDNCIKFIDFLVEKKRIGNAFKKSYYNRHHITFYCGVSEIPSNSCMQSAASNHDIKPLVYYEDLYVDKLVVELL